MGGGEGAKLSREKILILLLLQSPKQKYPTSAANTWAPYQLPKRDARFLKVLQPPGKKAMRQANSGRGLHPQSLQQRDASKVPSPDVGSRVIGGALAVGVH